MTNQIRIGHKEGNDLAVHHDLIESYLKLPKLPTSDLKDHMFQFQDVGSVLPRQKSELFQETLRIANPQIILYIFSSMP